MREQEEFLSLTESQLDPDWTRLPDEEQWDKANMFYTRLIERLAAREPGLQINIDVADRGERHLLLEAGAQEGLRGSLTLPLSERAVDAILHTNPTRAVIGDGRRELLWVFDTWDGVVTAYDPRDDVSAIMHFRD